MKARNLLGLVAAVTLCGTVSAGEVGPVTTFSAGSVAKAAEVNGNFDALIAAINDNASRIAALEAPSNEVAGRSYSLHYVGSYLTAEVDSDDGVRDFTSVEHYLGEGTLNFDSDGATTGNGSAADIAGAELIVNGDGSFHWSSDGAETAEPLAFTWSQSGNVVTMNIDGESETLNFVVSEDGSLLVGRGTDTGIDNRDDGSSADFSDVSTIILVRQP